MAESRRNQVRFFLLESGLENCHKCLGEKDRNLFKPQLWEFGNCMDGAMCREAEQSPREDRQRTWRGPKGYGPTELFQAQAAEAGSDLRSKQTVLAWFSHAQGKGYSLIPLLPALDPENLVATDGDLGM
ncbi:hypothetical protein TURU_070557 [Turdus rufiventris]|nr:hypothetical protein TURU_070557 [Turdus rufiventris]